MAEEFLAAKILVIRVLQSAGASGFIGKIVYVLEDCQTRHQPGRQRRPARLVSINRAKLLREELPIDRPRPLGERVPGVNDLIQP